MRRLPAAAALVLVKGRVTSPWPWLADVAPWLPWLTGLFAGSLRVERGADQAAAENDDAERRLKAMQGNNNRQREQPS